MSTQDNAAKLVFISYSSKDKDAAQRICELLEERGVPCWMAPRDIRPGAVFAEELVHAIDTTRALVLVMSEHSNASRHVLSEVTQAFAKGKTIFPVRMQDLQASAGLQLFVAQAQWIDAWRMPLAKAMDQLAEAAKPLMTEAGISVEPAPVRTSAGSRRMGMVWALLAAAVVVAAVGLTLYLRQTPEQATRGERAGAATGIVERPAGPSMPGGVVPRYHALVIGISAYNTAIPEPWTPLANARADAEAVADALEKKYGVDVVRLLDGEATRTAIVSRLDNMVALTTNDALLIYFAGHGYYDKQLGEGYWIPCDARRVANGRMANEDWIWNSTISKIVSASGARHVLVVADSCYSGSLFRGMEGVTASDNRTKWYRQAIMRPSRYLIASGDLEPVLDSGGRHSVFAQEVLNCLNRPDEPYLSASDIGLSVREKVAVLTKQMVQVGPLAVATHAGGEFVLVKPGEEDKLGAVPLESVAPDAGSGVGSAVAVASPAERQRLMMDALELAQRGAAGGASNLMALARREAPEDGLVAAVTAYLDQGRRAKARSDLQALIDSIAKQNAARQTNAAAGAADDSFARPRIVAALGPETRQGGSDAANRAMLYRIALRSELEGQGRMQLVEREAMDAILQEMNLGTSDLADPRARTQIGKMLPAGLLLLGDVMASGNNEMVFMRLVETETSRQLAAFSAERKGDREVLDVCHGLATQILAKAVALAPLTAKVAGIEGDRLQADVGSFHGAGEGMVFAIVRRSRDKPTLAGGFKDERVGEAKLKDLGQFSSGFDATWTDAAAKQTPEALWVKEMPSLCR